MDDFEASTLDRALLENDDVLVILPVIRHHEKYAKAFNPLIKEKQELWGLNIRRRMPLRILEKKRPELSERILDNRNRELLVDVAEVDNPHLGVGWSEPEKWGGEIVRAMNGNLAEIAFSLKSPAALRLETALYPYSYETSPSLSISVKMNGEPLCQIFPSKWWNDASVEIPQELTQTGVNMIGFFPNRILSPSDLDPECKDARRLSIWARKIKISLRD